MWLASWAAVVGGRSGLGGGGRLRREQRKRGGPFHSQTEAHMLSVIL